MFDMWARERWGAFAKAIREGLFYRVYLCVQKKRNLTGLYWFCVVPETPRWTSSWKIKATLTLLFPWTSHANLQLYPSPFTNLQRLNLSWTGESMKTNLLHLLCPSFYCISTSSQSTVVCAFLWCSPISKLSFPVAIVRSCSYLSALFFLPHVLHQAVRS